MSAEAKDWLTALVGHSDYSSFYVVSEASTQAAAAWQPKQSDVVVATYSKTGTTVLQMLVEMLRSQGDTDFEEITEVQPWLDFCFDIGIDPSAPQRNEPRVFKSHQRPAALNRGIRIASIVRDPTAVVRSYFAFYQAKDHPKTRGKTLSEWALEWAVEVYNSEEKHCSDHSCYLPPLATCLPVCPTCLPVCRYVLTITPSAAFLPAACHLRAAGWQ